MLTGSGSYWNRQSRRSVLRGGAMASLGLAGAALLGCSDDENKNAEGGKPDAGATTRAGGSAPSIRRGGKATAAMDQDVTQEVDPHDPGGNAQAVMNAFSHIYVGLTTWEPTEYKLKPAMAESWENPDPQTYIFHLRKGVKFHHGDVMTSEDAKFSHERNFGTKPAAPYKSWLAMVASVDTPDEFTIRYKLKYPFLNFPGIFAANRIGGIVSKKFTMDVAKNDLRSIGSGTGPWRLKEIIPNERLTLQRSDSFYEMGADGKSLPYMDELTYVPILEAASAVASVRTGEVAFTRLSTKNANLLAQDKNIELSRFPQGWHLGYSIFYEHPPMNDVRVRRALQISIDRADLINKVITTGWPVMSIPWQTLPDYGIAVKDMPAHYRAPDIAEAKKLLSAAGLSNGFTLELHDIPASSFTGNAAEVLREQWKAIGADFKNIQHPPGWSSPAENYPGHFGGAPWTSYPDPNFYIYNWMHSSTVRNATKPVPRWNDKKLDGMIEAALIEPNFKSRVEQYKAIQLYIDTESVQLSFYDKEYNEAVNTTKLKGYKPHPQNRSDFGMTRAWVA